MVSTPAHCVPCENGIAALSDRDIAEAKTRLPQWEFAQTSIHRRWKFKNYARALDFVNRLSMIAEEQSHHPDVRFGWGYVEITLSTHSANAITQNDVVMAELIEKIEA